MSAILLLGMGLLKAGDHVVCSQSVFGSTIMLFGREFAKFGVETTFVSQTDVAQWRAAVRPEHQAAVRRVADQPADRGVRHPRAGRDRARAPARWLAVDNCFCSPALQRPVELRRRLRHPLGHQVPRRPGPGHRRRRLRRARRWSTSKFVPVMRSAGMTLSPFNAWVVLKGLETLSIRMQAQSERALALARWLETQPAVERVYYPGLESHPQHALAMAQQSGCGGAVVSFVVKARGSDAARWRAATPSTSSTHRRSARSPPTSATPRRRSPIRPAPRTAASPKRSARRPASRRDDPRRGGARRRRGHQGRPRARARRAVSAATRRMLRRRCVRARCAPASRRRRPASCTSAPRAPRCSPGPSRATTAASSSCASRTPTSRARRRSRSTRSSRRCAGSGSTTTRARSTRCSASSAIARGRRADARRRHRLPLLLPRPAELEAMREAQRARGEKTHYDGRWRPEPGKTLPPVPEGVPPVIRFRNPPRRRRDAGTTWSRARSRSRTTRSTTSSSCAPTACRPTTSASSSTTGTCAISHVFRGDEHVNNTPWQINIFAALGAPLPLFAHVPIILGDDGQKLSKRRGAVSVTATDEAGYLPEAMLNYLARLGWSHGDEELFSREQLVDGSTAAISRRARRSGMRPSSTGSMRTTSSTADDARWPRWSRAQLARRGIRRRPTRRRWRALRRCSRTAAATGAELADWLAMLSRRCRRRAPRTSRCM